MGEVKYLVSNWKNFLYVIITNVSKGYWYFSQFQYPERKKEKFKKIDEKIINKYLIHLSKDQRYRRKKKGLANYLFFRWKNNCILLKTEGKKLEQDDENWRKISNSDYIIILVGSIVFEIKEINKKISVKLSKSSFREIKAEIREKLSKKDLEYAIKIFNRLNGLPNYSFLFKQKKEIKKFFISECKKHIGKIKNIKEKLIIKKVPLKKGKLFLEE